jgi:hypothetical protein
MTEAVNANLRGNATTRKAVLRDAINACQAPADFNNPSGPKSRVLSDNRNSRIQCYPLLVFALFTTQMKAGDFIIS